MNDLQISKIQSQIAEFRDTLHAARDAVRTVNAAIQETIKAPPPREQCLTAFESALNLYVDPTQTFVKNHVDRWLATDPSLRVESLRENFAINIAHDPNIFHKTLLWPSIAREFAAQIEALPWPENALNDAQRHQRLAALEPQKNAADAALNALEAQAEKLGIH